FWLYQSHLLYYSLLSSRPSLYPLSLHDALPISLAYIIIAFFLGCNGSCCLTSFISILSVTDTSSPSLNASLFSSLSLMSKYSYKRFGLFGSLFVNITVFILSSSRDFLLIETDTFMIFTD